MYGKLRERNNLIFEKEWIIKTNYKSSSIENEKIILNLNFKINENKCESKFENEFKNKYWVINFKILVNIFYHICQ